MNPRPASKKVFVTSSLFVNNHWLRNSQEKIRALVPFGLSGLLNLGYHGLNCKFAMMLFVVDQKVTTQVFNSLSQVSKNKGVNGLCQLGKLLYFYFQICLCRPTGLRVAGHRSRVLRITLIKSASCGFFGSMVLEPQLFKPTLIQNSNGLVVRWGGALQRKSIRVQSLLFPKCLFSLHT